MAGTANSDGGFSYRLSVDSDQALKDTAAFAKEHVRATKQINANIEDQIKKNTTLDQSIIRQRAEISKSRAEYKKYTTTKKEDAAEAARAANDIEQLNLQLHTQTEELRQGKRAIRGYTAELDKLATAEKRALNRGGTQYKNPIGPRGATKYQGRNSYGSPFNSASFAMPGGIGDSGFRGQVGARATYGRGARNLKAQAGSAFAGGAGIGGLATSLGAGFALKSSVQTAAALDQQQLKLKVLSKSYGEYDEILKEISRNADMFNKSQRDATTEFANVYARLRPLGIELNDIKDVYKGFNAVAISSGASAESTRIAFMQLSQALGSGRLAGDEFRSISEQIPGVLIPIAAELGVTVGELKKLGAEGKLTSDVLIKSLGKGFDLNKDKIKQLLAQSPSAKFTALGNAISDTANTIGEALLPAVLPLTEALTRLLKTIQRLPSPIKALAGVLGGLGLAFGAAAGAAKALGTTLSVTALGGLAIFAAKLALVAAPLIALGMVFEENIRKKQEFDEALASDEPEIMKDKIDELVGVQESLKKQLSSKKKLPFYRGQSGEVLDLQKRIKELQVQLEKLTKRRTLIIDIVTKVHKIGGIDYKMDGPNGRLVPVNAPETVSQQLEREAKEAADKAKNTKKTRGGANTAQQIAKINSENRRRLSELGARHDLKLLNERYKIERRLQEESYRLAEANSLGAARAQLQIENQQIAVNSAIDAQVRRLDDRINEAERRLEAARQRLSEAAPGVDASRAQGIVDKAQLGLSSAEGVREQFAANTLKMRNNALDAAVAQSTEGFRQRAHDAMLEADALKERNRLMMEGFSPSQVDLQMQLSEIERERVSRISSLVEGSAGYAISLSSINEKALLAANAVTALTSAQEDNNNALTNYISDAQAYVGDLKGRIVEVGSAVESSISSAITGLIDGTKTAGQAFQDFFKNVGKAFLTMASQMIAKLVIIKLLKAAIGMFGNKGANPNELNIDGVQKYMNPSLPTGEYANGGIVTGPTNALIGEGGMNEAVVPLPNGRAIPVDFGRGSMGAVNNTTITVNVDSDGNSDTQTSDQASKFGVAIDRAVKRVIMDERRSGGLLSGAR